MKAFLLLGCLSVAAVLLTFPSTANCQGLAEDRSNGGGDRGNGDHDGGPDRGKPNPPSPPHDFPHPPPRPPPPPPPPPPHRFPPPPPPPPHPLPPPPHKFPPPPPPCAREGQSCGFNFPSDCCEKLFCKPASFEKFGKCELEDVGRPH